MQSNEQQQHQSIISRLSNFMNNLRKKCQICPTVQDDPRLLNKRIKREIIACVSLVACTAGLSSTIYFPGLPYITQDLNAPPIANTLSAALFVLFLGLDSVVWAAISEHFHIRRFLFLVAMTIFMTSSLSAVFVTNIWSLVEIRCIQSIGVSSGTSIGAGYIADLYPIEERGAAIGKYMFGSLFGPLVGPVIGGFLIMSLPGWRATFWFCFVFGLFILGVCFFFLPETYRNGDDTKFYHVQLPISIKEIDLGMINHSHIMNDISVINNNAAVNGVVMMRVTADNGNSNNNSSIDNKSQKSTRSSRSTLLNNDSRSLITINDDDITDCIIHHGHYYYYEEEIYHVNSTLYSNTLSFEKQSPPMTTIEPTITTTITKKPTRFNPFAPFALLCYPFVFIPSITAGLFFGTMFATEAILPQAFSDTYGLNAWRTGLCYLGAGIGNLSGTFVGTHLSDRLLLRSRRLRSGGKAKAEDRLTANIWFAGLVFNPLGLLLFGWVVEYQLSIWGAIIGFGIQCFANIQVMTTVMAYLVDSVPDQHASVIAAANFLRLGFGCILTVMSNPMLAQLGPGWTCTLFAALTSFGMIFAIVLKIWGEPIRRWSGY